MRTTACLVIIGLLLSGCAKSQRKQDVLFPDWKPSLDQPIWQLEETLAKLEQQQPMNYTISNVARLYDAKLYMLFHDFLASLPESERASQIAEQNQWLRQRETQVHDASKEHEGGTLAPYTAGNAKISATKKRIEEIERRMNGASNKELKATR